MNQLPVDWGQSNEPQRQSPGRFPRHFRRTPLDAWLGDLELEASPRAEPLRFHLWELMVTITTAAVLLALFRGLGIIGAALAFFAAVIFTNYAYPKLNPTAPGRQATMFDFVWGAIMPLVCLTFDPFVFKFGDTPLLHQDFGGPAPSLFRTATIYPWSWPVYAIIGWQIVCLGVWLIAGRLPAGLTGFWAGMLWLGFTVAFLLGIVLALPATVAAVAGIGVLGFTPLFTARTFYRRAIAATRLAKDEAPHYADWPLRIGVVAAVIIPGVLGGILGLWISSFLPVR